MISRTSDGSIIDAGGRVLYFSIERFIEDICIGQCCFICGRHPDNTAFNDEHVLPRWLLQRYQLFDRAITLPNLSGFRYGQYTVPCCVDCNALMGARIETPISALVAGGYTAFSNHIATHGALIPFVWMALIFLKTHLRDRQFRVKRDQRQGGALIGDSYTWHELHHVHCVARSFFTETVVTAEAFGSLLCWPMKTQDHYEHFDYADLHASRSALLRMGTVGLVAVFDDSNAALSAFAPWLSRITGSLSPFQLREVFAHLSFINASLKDRPAFKTEVDANGRSRIVCLRPAGIELEPHSNADFGELFWSAMQPISGRLIGPHPDIPGQIRKGEWSFLFDEQDKFIEDSIVGPVDRL